MSSTNLKRKSGGNLNHERLKKSKVQSSDESEIETTGTTKAKKVRSAKRKSKAAKEVKEPLPLYPTNIMAGIESNEALAKQTLEAESAIPATSKASIPAPFAPKKKNDPAQARLTERWREKVEDLAVGIFVALDKSVKIKAKTEVFHLLPRWIANRELTGHTTTVKCATSFYAVIFDTTLHRDQALTYLSTQVYQFEDEPVQLIITKFGTPARNENVVWTVQADPLDSGVQVAAAVRAHIFKYYVAGYRSDIKVYAILESNKKTGDWAVAFANAPPTTNWKKKLEVDRGEYWCVVKEPTVCRFCGKKGHTIIECNEGGYKSVSAMVTTGVVEGGVLGETDGEGGMFILE